MTRDRRQAAILLKLRGPGTPPSASQLAADLETTVALIQSDREFLESRGLLPKSSVDMAVPAFTLPELHAIGLGLAWVRGDEDSALFDAAATASDKIEAMLPPPPRELENGVEPASDAPADIVKAAILAERVLSIDYSDKKGKQTSRCIWPIDFVSYEDTDLVVAWCEHRSDFRQFRLDRISHMVMQDRYPTRRSILLARWELEDGVFH